MMQNPRLKLYTIQLRKNSIFYIGDMNCKQLVNNQITVIGTCYECLF